MKYYPGKHHRRSIRLKGYDYSQPGAYFVTICIWNRGCVFGEIENAEMNLNEYGFIFQDCWNNLVYHYSHIQLDTYVIMPNHVHGIIIITDTGVEAGSCVRAGLKPSPTDKLHRLPEIVRALKTFSSRKINIARSTCGVPVWQRNYYEHIVRNEKELNSIREYIINNPLQWDLDENNPKNIKPT